jgi:hypothetical protein
MIQKLAILMHHPDTATVQRHVIARECPHLAVKEGDMARRGQQFGIAQLEEGRFPRPRRPRQKVERPRRKAQRDVRQKLAPAIAVGDILEGDHRACPVFRACAGTIAQGRGRFNDCSCNINHNHLEIVAFIDTRYI